MERNSSEELLFEGWLCPECRYDLRGLREAVCPECGTEFECRSCDHGWLRWIVGIGALMVSVLFSALGLLTGFLSFEDHMRYVGRQRCCCGNAVEVYTLVMPFALCVAIVSMVIAKRMGFAAPVARLGVVSLSALWAMGWIVMIGFAQ
jgi:hypothetical protein